MVVVDVVWCLVQHFEPPFQELRELAAAAAAALADAPDAGAEGYAAVLQRLVGADPAAWTADVPAVLAALARPELGAFCLAATATVARRPDAFPAGPAEAVLAALTLSCALPAPASSHVPGGVSDPSARVVGVRQGAVGRGAGGDMGTGPGDGWEGGVDWEGWRDHRDIRRRLDQGADPEALACGERPLHRAVAFGSPEVVAELAGRVADADALEDGTTALWEAVVGHRPEIARVLVAAGADPWRPVLAGWSPGRLSLAGPTPELFPLPEGEPGLSEAESAAARAGRRRIAALADVGYYDGTGLACVAGIDAQEAVRRLAAVPPDAGLLAELLDDPYGVDTDDSLRIVGVTTVPGGCVVTQAWGYGPQMPGVQALLSAGTVCYGMYANPKSGNQGSLVRDGVVEGWDLHPGGGPCTGTPPEEVLTAYIYGSHAIAECCAHAGLFPADPRPFTGPPDLWVELPERDYWRH